MRKIILLNAILCLMVFTSCDTVCPAFPPYLTDYLPNKNLFTYVNENNDTVKLKSIEYMISPESICRRGLFSKCYCRSNLRQGLGDYENDKFYLVSVVYADKKKNIIKVDWSKFIYDENGKRTSQTTRFEYIKEGVNGFRSENYALFGEEVELYPQEGDPSDFINKIVIKRGIGIVEFYDVEKSCTWRLVETK